MNELDRHPELKRVAVERDRQIAKWGEQEQASLYEWVSILTEELGELAKAVNDHDLPEAGKEAVEVAAVAVKIVQVIERIGVDIPWPTISDPVRPDLLKGLPSVTVPDGWRVERIVARQEYSHNLPVWKVVVGRKLEPGHSGFTQMAADGSTLQEAIDRATSE